MSAKSSPGTLPPIPFERAPITPLPEVTELPAWLGWPIWDAVVRELDRKAMQ